MSTDLSERREVARGELELSSCRVPYRVIRSGRARHIRLRMLSGGIVEVVVPPRIHVPPIEEILHAKRRWIERQLERLHGLPPIRPNCIDYLGCEYDVVVQRHPGPTGRISLQDRSIRVEAPNRVEVAPLVESFLRRQARAVLRERAAAWAEALQVQYRRLSVRDQRTRWGSCSVNGGLNFNWRLVMAPLPVLDYVVIHELMHLREMNHGTQFWDGVESYCPEYKIHRAWLKEHGAMLARPLHIDR